MRKQKKAKKSLPAGRKHVNFSIHFQPANSPVTGLKNPDDPSFIDLKKAIARSENIEKIARKLLIK